MGVVVTTEQLQNSFLFDSSFERNISEGVKDHEMGKFLGFFEAEGGEPLMASDDDRDSEFEADDFDDTNINLRDGLDSDGCRNSELDFDD